MSSYKELGAVSARYEYSGEQTRCCPQCGIEIYEGDYVILERFEWQGKKFTSAWHPECWNKAEEDANRTNI